MSEPIEEIALTLTCPFCGAEPGFACETRSGAAYYYLLHARRTRPIRAAYLVGRAEGYRTGVEQGRKWGAA